MVYTALYPNEKAVSAAAFLAAATGYFHSFYIPVRSVLTDNGPCFRSDLFRDICKALNITPKTIRLYTPKTNGKAERFIQTAIRDGPTPEATKPPQNDHNTFSHGPRLQLAQTTC